MKHFLFISALLVCAAGSVLAQSNIIDEVIWIIGDDAILRSDVEKERLEYQQNRVSIPGDPNCIIPEMIAVKKLFLHQADLDSVQANESYINLQLDYYINASIDEAGSVEKLEEYRGQKLSEYREELYTRIKEDNLVSEVRRNLVGDIKSTPADIRRFYSGLHKDSIPMVPAQVELQIVSVAPPISDEEVENVKQRLREFTERVQNKTTSFSTLARLYSEDLGTARRGGETGLFGKAEMTPEFSAVAFNLQTPDKVSRIVQTEYGFHILQLIEKRGDRANVRHILLKPKPSLEEKNLAVKQMDSVANQIRNQKITFEEAVAYFSQDKNTVMNGGIMMNNKTGATKFEYQDLPTEIAKMAYSMNVGEISKPFIMIDPTTNKEVVAIVKVKTKTENHKANLKDDYQLVKEMYEAQEQEKFLHKWITQKQKETYISIDPAWQNCEFQYPGWIKK